MKDKSINQLIKEGRFQEADELMDKVREMQRTQFDFFIKYYPYALLVACIILSVFFILLDLTK